MGSALARAWVKEGNISLSILDPQEIPNDIQTHCQTHFTSYSDINISFDIIVLAIKPQILDQVCERLSSVIQSKSLILSIAAGTSLSSLEKHFEKNQPIIRTMPNLPASIGEGISVCISNTHCTDQHIHTAEELMNSVGEVEWIKDESHMNAVTALSGSGPAYLFLLVEAMSHAGVECGLSEDLALKLARQTVIGSAHLLQENNGLSATQCRKNVTSKGGTTEAALKILMKDNALITLMTKAIQQARIRGEEL